MKRPTYLFSFLFRLVDDIIDRRLDSCCHIRTGPIHASAFHPVANQADATAKGHEMEIRNLEINILYCMCSALNGQLQDGTIDSGSVYAEFSDIPDRSVASAIDSMVADGWVTIDRSRLSITENGIHRLQSAGVCRSHRYGRCWCGDYIGRRPQGQSAGHHP